MVRQAPRAPVAAVALAGLALSGCLGGESESGAPAGQGANVGAPIPLANCGDWRQATPQQRQGTVQELKAFAGGPTGGGQGRRGATLDDDRAYELLEDSCARDFARGFKLYKLYTRAAAFRKQRPQ